MGVLLGICTRSDRGPIVLWTQQHIQLHHTITHGFPRLCGPAGHFHPPLCHMFFGCMEKVWQSWDITIEILYIQAIGISRCGPRSGRICKTTKPSPGRCGVWCELQVATDILQALSCVLWMHGKGLIGLWYNMYTEMPSPRPQTSQYVGRDLTGSAKNHQDVKKEVGFVMRGNSVHGWAAIHFTYLLHALERSDIPGM